MSNDINASEDELDVNKYILHSNIKKLYHSTAVRDETSKEYFEELVEYTPGYILPEIGSYSKDLNHSKFFTVTDGCTYFFNCTWVFLEYDVIKPIKLFDMYNFIIDRCYNELPISEFNSVRNNLVELLGKSGKIDGYIDKEDCVEICLFRPGECVGEHKIITPEECDMNHEYERSMLL